MHYLSIEIKVTRFGDLKPIYITITVENLSTSLRLHVLNIYYVIDWYY